MIQYLIRSRLTVVWLVLMGATAVSWEIGHGVHGSDGRMAEAIVILVACAKTRYIVLDFMELRHGPANLRIVAELWVAVLGVALAALCFTSHFSPPT